MKPSHSPAAYQSVPTKWTRIDLLIALYDRTVATLRLLAEAISADDPHVMKFKTRTIFLLDQIVDGIDSEECTFATEIMSICQFALRGVEENNVETINASASAIAKVQDGFSHIRSDAVALENVGTIPPIHSPIEMEG